MKLPPAVTYFADKGYQGLQKLNLNSRTPKKKLRGTNLTDGNRQHNRDLAGLRVVGEHVNRRLKVFKILSERYRNRHKRFGLRFNLIAGLYNFELALTNWPFAKALIDQSRWKCTKSMYLGLFMLLLLRLRVR